MPKFDRYLLGDFFLSFAATLTVLVVVGLGGVLVDLLGNIADGRFPATLLMTQLGLQFIVYLPLLLPLALMLGLLLALARLYRDSEMAVIMAMGIGPKRLLRPILGLVLPVVGAVALCALWLGPWASRTANHAIEQANRSVVLAGLDAGDFTTLPKGGVVYLAKISTDGVLLNQVFLQRENRGRLDIITAAQGTMHLNGKADRFLRLNHGYRFNAPADDQTLDYHTLAFERADVLLPDRTTLIKEANDPDIMTTFQLLKDPRREAKAQLHRRIATPCLAFAFALLTLPLSRTGPRQQRYGRILLGFLAYMIGINLMMMGAQWLAAGKLPMSVGLWWLTVPLLAIAVWAYATDGRLRRFWG